MARRAADPAVPRAREQHRKRRSARRHLGEMALVERLRRRLDEPRNELVVVLRRDPAVRLADPEEGGRVPLEPVTAAARLERVEELVEEAPTPHAVPQARLVGREHEEHLVHEELRVVRIVSATEAEQQVDLVDAREVTRIRAPVLRAADAVGLVVGTNAVEEPVDVELGEEDVVEGAHVIEGAARILEQGLGDRVGDAEGRDAGQARPRPVCRRGSPACCSRGRGIRRRAT